MSENLVEDRIDLNQSLGSSQALSTLDSIPRHPRWRHAGSISSSKAPSGQAVISQTWGTLEQAVLRSIITHTLGKTQIDEILQSNIRGLNSNHKKKVIDMLLKRNWLLKLRLVSKAWRTAVNSHPFWLEYIQVFAPNFQPHEAMFVHPAYDLARYSTRTNCVVCTLLSRPSPEQEWAYSSILTTKFGSVLTCDDHFDYCCVICLRPAVYETEESDEDVNGLKSGTLNDADEQDRLLPEGMTCCHCRKYILLERATQELVKCMRRPVEMKQYLHRIFQLPSYTAFVEEGEGTSYAAGRDVVEELFFWSHTRYRSAIWSARKLQNLYQRLKYYIMRRKRPFTVALRDEWARLQSEFWGPILWDFTRENEEWKELVSLQQGWITYELLTKDGMFRGLSPTSDDGEVGDENDVRNIELEPYWRTKLIHVCAHDWVVQRIKAGWWVLPSDELDQLRAIQRGSTEQVHSPLNEIAHTLARPGPRSAYPHSTLFHLQAGIAMFQQYRYIEPQSFDCNHSKALVNDVLPTERIVKLLDKAFRIQLENILSIALSQIVEGVAASNGMNEDATEKECASWSMEKLIGALGETRTWELGGRAAIGYEEWRRKEVSNLKPTNSSSERIIRTNHRGIGNAGSPRIEFVLDDEMNSAHAVDYGIKEFNSESELELEREEQPIENTSKEKSGDLSTSSTDSASRAKKRKLSEDIQGISSGERSRSPDGEEVTLMSASLIRSESGSRLGSGSSEVSSMAPLTPSDQQDEMVEDIKMAMISSIGSVVELGVASMVNNLGTVRNKGSRGLNEEVQMVDEESVMRDARYGRRSGEREEAHDSSSDEERVQQTGSSSSPSMFVLPTRASSSTLGRDMEEEIEMEEENNEGEENSEDELSDEFDVETYDEEDSEKSNNEENEDEDKVEEMGMSMGMRAIDDAKMNGDFMDRHVYKHRHKQESASKHNGNPLSKDNRIGKSDSAIIPDAIVPTTTVSTRTNPSDPFLAQAQAALQARTTSPSPTTIEYIINPSQIPLIPSPQSRLGPGVRMILENTWWKAREDLRECKCSICERAKKRDLGWLSGALGSGAVAVGERTKRVRLE